MGVRSLPDGADLASHFLQRATSGSGGTSCAAVGSTFDPTRWSGEDGADDVWDFWSSLVLSCLHFCWFHVVYPNCKKHVIIQLFEVYPSSWSFNDEKIRKPMVKMGIPIWETPMPCISLCPYGLMSFRVIQKNYRIEGDGKKAGKPATRFHLCTWPCMQFYPFMHLAGRLELSWIVVWTRRVQCLFVKLGDGLKHVLVLSIPDCRRHFLWFGLVIDSTPSAMSVLVFNTTHPN